MLGTLGCVLSSSWVVLAIFWFILGLAVSGTSAVVPVFLAEIAPSETRGRIVTRNGFLSRCAGLVAKGRNAEAHEVLKLIRSPKWAGAELEENRKVIQVGWSAILHTGRIRRVVLIGAGIGVFSQFSGISVIMYHGTELLKDSGFSVFMLWRAHGLVTLGFLSVVTAIRVGAVFGIFALPIAPVLWGVPEFRRPRHAPSGKL